MDERAFFDKLAPTWDDNEILSTPERINYILDFCDIKSDESILDLGTGTGVLLPYLAERIGEGGKITAVDYSSGMLDIAVRKFAGIRPKPIFLNLDFENDNIDGKFDKIFLYSVYPHLHTPIDTIKWLKAVNLKQGGSIIIAFPTDEEFINSIHRERHSDSDFLPPADKLCDYLRSNGLNSKVINADKQSYIIAIS